jgi:hypothetical protein
MADKDAGGDAMSHIDSRIIAGYSHSFVASVWNIAEFLFARALSCRRATCLPAQQHTRSSSTQPATRAGLFNNIKTVDEEKKVWGSSVGTGHHPQNQLNRYGVVGVEK